MIQTLKADKNTHLHKLIQAIEAGRHECISFEDNVLESIESMLQYSDFIPIPPESINNYLHTSRWQKAIIERNNSTNLYVEIFSNNFMSNWHNTFTIINVYTHNA